MALLILACVSMTDVSPLVGVNIHFTGAPARDLDLIQQAGFGWIRMDFSWGGVEREKGIYRFELHDQLLDGLTSRGIRALFILDYSNKLYEDQGSVRTGAGRAAFARFAAAAAARYKGRGVRWEIWNEPNLAQFWKPEPSADDYAALAIEAAKAIRAADPLAVIAAPASSGMPAPFLERIFEKGLLAHIDEVSVHPYRNAAPETVIPDYARLRELIGKHLAPGRKLPPILSGEWGYSNLHYGGQPIALDLQAAFLARELLTNIAEGIVLSIWYDWANDGPDPKETEHNFGTVTQDRKPKPAYLAARTLTAALKGATFDRRLHGSSGDHLLLFAAGESTILAAWTEGEPHAARLEIAGFSGQVAATGFTGEASSLEAKDGGVGAPLDGQPRYLELPVAPTKVAVHGLDVVPYGQAFRIVARRSGSGTREGRLEIRVGDRVRTEKVTLDEKKDAVVDLRADLPVRIGATLLDPRDRRQLAELPPRWYRPVPAFQESLATALDGDRQVDGEAKVSLQDVSAGGRPPISKALRVDYRFQKGWKFARAAPRTHLEIPGKPVALSIWVDGDGSGNHLRSRFVDSSGETFQPSAGEIHWKGWRRVEIPMDGSGGAGHWGGDKNGRIDYPIRWDSLFVLDSNRQGSSGAIRLACPVLIYAGE